MTYVEGTSRQATERTGSTNEAMVWGRRRAAAASATSGEHVL